MGREGSLQWVGPGWVGVGWDVVSPVRSVGRFHLASTLSSNLDISNGGQ